MELLKRKIWSICHVSSCLMTACFDRFMDSISNIFEFQCNHFLVELSILCSKFIFASDVCFHGQVAPMSVYACLGSDAAAIRDAFLTHLQSKIEDMRIKVMILEFLTVAVETQPGLIELFLNLEVKDGSDGSKVQ